MFEWDVATTSFIADHRVAFATRIFESITALGDAWFSIFAAGIISIFLYGMRLRSSAIGVCIASCGSAITVWLLKILFSVPRPEIALIAIDSYAFPSGHAAAALALYGSIIYVSSTYVPAGYQRTLVTAGFSLLILGIGFSRLYLGVHYPSDIAAGYVIGAAWVAIGMYAGRRITSGRRVAPAAR